MYKYYQTAMQAGQERFFYRALVVQALLFFVPFVSFVNFVFQALFSSCPS